MLLFVAAVALTAIGTYQHLAFEQDVNRGVQDVLSNDEYSSLELANVKTEYDAGVVLGDDPTVTVTVSRASDTEYNQLAEDLREDISARTDQPVTVQVRFVDYEQSSPPPAAQDSGSLLDRLRNLIARWWSASTADAVPQTVPHPPNLVGERPGAA